MSSVLAVSSLDCNSSILMRKDDSCSFNCVIVQADAVWCSLSIRRARNREYPASKATKMGINGDHRNTKFNGEYNKK